MRQRIAELQRVYHPANLDGLLLIARLNAHFDKGMVIRH